MTKRTYAFPPGGLPPQTDDCNSTAVFTEAYAILPASTMRDIVTSYLPGWTDTRLWVLARPLSGFAETFSQTMVDVAPGGGSKAPEPEAEAESVLFILGGDGLLTMNGVHQLTPGSYAYIPAGTAWEIGAGSHGLQFTWVRKRFQPAAGVTTPEPFVVHEDDIAAIPMPDTDGAWATKRFVEPTDLRHDMHVNIVEFQPGGSIPFLETHVMEHGLYVLEGQADYRINRDWIKVVPGDFMWLRAFCPQACIATGDGPFRYLLYKDVNRHMPLSV